MSECKYSFSKNKYLGTTVMILCFCSLLFSCDNNTEASEFPECFVGTYLNEEGSGAKSIWNLSSDGTFTGQSSTEKVFNFTGQMGAWRSTGSNSAEILMLDFSFDEQGNFANTARIDIEIEFEGENCEETVGSFELRFFEEDEDPLDVSTDTGEAIEDTYTGRKVIIQ
ncbi:MAG: hypothetical protein GWO07_08440 [Candidatus Dadabacteria bacterium]|nr:hypothetical protein [Candidatus Dadabacteria bacterium]NIS08774.1 hypothetical protein [Candidatus Dadabacteria bacterium]NIV42717.1 hypothetical protein [Candidatus Dadabacteria bacterium]NIX15460.1 hypothetical protein [Candidatus Dadabacteria bacterium]NIY22122.1 hypothetical protein [Candidatus Dadabacteria bacterium]